MAASTALLVGFIYLPVNSLLALVPLNLFNWTVIGLGIIVGWFTALAITKAVMKYIE
jgi:hypothetical protein